MELDVLIFGAAALAAGSDRVSVRVADRPRVRDVLAAIHEQHPSLRFALPAADSGRLALNQSFASGDDLVEPEAEIALVTLVGGG